MRDIRGVEERRGDPDTRGEEGGIRGLRIGAFPARTEGGGMK